MALNIKRIQQQKILSALYFPSSDLYCVHYSKSKPELEENIRTKSLVYFLWCRTLSHLSGLYSLKGSVKHYSFPPHHCSHHYYYFLPGSFLHFVYIISIILFFLLNSLLHFHFIASLVSPAIITVSICSWLKLDESKVITNTDTHKRLSTPSQWSCELKCLPSKRRCFPVSSAHFHTHPSKLHKFIQLIS